MNVTVFSNSPPGGRCKLYTRYADALGRVLDNVSVNLTYPGKNPATGPAAPALAIDDRLVAPSDGVIVAPEDIAQTLTDMGLAGAAKCLASLEQVQSEFIEETSVSESPDLITDPHRRLAGTDVLSAAVQGSEQP